MEHAVGAGRGAEERQPVAVRQEAAAGRPKGDVRAAGQADAKGVPVEATVEEPEAAGVDVHEHPLIDQHGEVEGQPLHLGGRDADPLGYELGMRLDAVRLW